MGRPRVAFFDFACCEGCQLQIANLGEALIEVLGLVELVEFREVMSERYDGRFDLAIVEGSISTEEAEQRILRIRERSELLIAYGSCATIGGINGIRNARPLKEAQTCVYPGHEALFPSGQVRAVHQVVPVDYFIHGCPIYPPEFLAVLKAALAGLPYPVPDYAVCVECKFNENVCMYDKGVTCLGPVTRAGCNSWCVNHGNVCYGCRGMVSNPNLQGATEVLQRYGLKTDQLANKMTMYTQALEAEDE